MPLNLCLFACIINNKKRCVLSLHFMQIVSACFFLHMKETRVNMFSSEEISQTTEALDKLPRTFDRRSALNERRQHILQQKQTDVLPVLGSESPSTKWAWRQMVQLREENRRLRASLEDLRVEMQQLVADKM